MVYRLLQRLLHVKPLYFPYEMEFCHLILLFLAKILNHISIGLLNHLSLSFSLNFNSKEQEVQNSLYNQLTSHLYSYLSYYFMDLLVSQKIHAAIEPLIGKIHLLEEQVKLMSTQIQTLQASQNKPSSYNFTCTQSQTQQTRLEPKLAEKPKTTKQAVVQKVNPTKKDTNVSKIQVKTQATQVNHNAKKQTKKQIPKPKAHNPKETKNNHHEIAQKQKLKAEEEKGTQVVEELKEEIKQEGKIEVQSPLTYQIDATKQANQLQEDHSLDKQGETSTGIMENLPAEMHQSSLLQKVQPVEAHQKQDQQLIQNQNAKETEDIKNQVMLPNVETQNKDNDLQALTNSNLLKPQNQNLDNHPENIQKHQSSESNSHNNENQIKVQPNQHLEPALENQTVVKQQKPAAKPENGKPAAKVTKETKALVSPATKKQGNSKKPIEQNRDKMNKSAIIHKDKVENKQSKLSVKENGPKQKNGGKSVDPAKKTKPKAEPKTEEKKGIDVKENVQKPLNQQNVEEEKQKVEKQQEASLQVEMQGECEGQKVA